MEGLHIALLKPHLLLALAAAWAAVRLWRRGAPRRPFLWLMAPLVGLVVLCLPVVSHYAVGSLEWRNPPLRDRPADAGAIVVLGGGLDPADAVRPKTELGSHTLFRCLRAAELYRQGTPCPVICCGGTIAGTTVSESGAMADFLATQGVATADLVTEDGSSSTYENAIGAARILGERRISKVLLVTDGFHLPRALACFRRQGVEAVAAGCSYKATEFHFGLRALLPSLNAARGVDTAAHEWIGLAWYWLRGRI